MRITLYFCLLSRTGKQRWTFIVRVKTTSKLSKTGVSVPHPVPTAVVIHTPHYSGNTIYQDQGKPEDNLNNFSIFKSGIFYMDSFFKGLAATANQGLALPVSLCGYYSSSIMSFKDNVIRKWGRVSHLNCRTTIIVATLVQRKSRHRAKNAFEQGGKYITSKTNKHAI